MKFKIGKNYFDLIFFYVNRKWGLWEVLGEFGLSFLENLFFFKGYKKKIYDFRWEV